MKTRSKPKRPPAKTKTRALPGTVDALLTFADFAAAISLGPRHTRRKIQRGELPKPDVMFGRSPRWRVSTYEKFVSGEWVPTATERLEVDAE